MTAGGIIFFVLLFWFIGGIILLVLSFISFKKNKIIRAIVLAIIGLVFFIPPVHTLSRMYAFIPRNNILLEYNYIKEFTQINKGFSEIYKSNKETVIGMNLEINGFINGKGNVLIIRQPYEENNGIIIEVDGKIYKRHSVSPNAIQIIPLLGFSSQVFFEGVHLIISRFLIRPAGLLS